MKRSLLLIGLLLICRVVLAAEPMITLPAPTTDGKVSLEKVLNERRSFRDFTADSISLAELSQLLWAAQGMTSDQGKRTAPSAMATYPLELYSLVKRVKGLNPGLYRYLPGPKPGEHKLDRVRDASAATEFSTAFKQVIAEKCAAALIFTWDPARATKLGKKAESFAYVEAGHAAQNALLEAQALGLGAVPAAGFEPADIKKFMDISTDPIYIVPVGKK
jgi:SagB-type dehydrogenase family enzyme